MKIKLFFGNPQIFNNSQMASKDIDKYCNLQPEGLNLLINAIEKLSL
ncbi:MAG: hypothetical protein CL661_03970 [Bacteroidetes bacterium]|nr:hypothetical protein [Bacteroidota bacterium]